MTGDWQKEAYGFQGTSREERALRALLPENIRIDGRNLHHWLAFLARSARLIRFFDQNNEPAGTWASFLKKDPSVSLALLLDNRPNSWDNEVRELIKRFYEVEEEESRKTACLDLARKTMKMAKYLDSWYRDAAYLSTWGKESPVKAVLEGAIRAELSDKVKELWGIFEVDLPSIRTEAESIFSAFHPVWQLQPPSGIDPLAQDAAGQSLDDTVNKLRGIFQRLHFRMTYIAERAPGWFKESLEQHDDHEPFTALLLAFLQLFTHLRDQLNTYPQRHLHHYYLDLLRQQPKKHVPDRTTVCFQLADHVTSYRLEKGALLLADVDEAGLESHYATGQELLVTQARVASLKTLYLSRADGLKMGSGTPLTTAIYAAPVANSRDGQGAPFVGSDRYWPVFGEAQWDKSPGDQRMTDARIGFVIAAPILALREGNREIDLQCQFTEESFAHLSDRLKEIGENTGKPADGLIVQLFTNALRVYATGVAGWFQLKHWRLDPTKGGLQNHTLTLTIYLSEGDPAIVDPVPATLDESFDSPWPLLKIVLNPDDDVYLYDFLQALELETVRIETRVQGLKSLTLLNELGLIDASAPFSPFGPMPNRSAYLLVGSAELFRKRLSALSFHIEWNNLPDLKGGFAEYYREYDQKIDNNSFQVGLSALSGGVFRPLPAAQQSFPLFAAARPDGPLAADVTLKDIQMERLQIQPNYALGNLAEYSNHARSGYFKLQLTQPPFAFGHADYPRLFSKAMIAQTRTGGLFGLGPRGQEVPLPREPYVPTIEKLTVAYTAATTLHLRPLEYRKNDEAAQEKIFCLYPFGHREIFANGKPIDTGLFPRFDADGYLHIGLEAAEPEQPVSFFFHIRERYVEGLEAHARHEAPVLQWDCLRDNRWEALPRESIVADTTNQFATKGIVKIVLPTDIDTANTLMPSGLFWLRASIRGDFDSIGDALAVYINAVEAVWVDNGDLSHFDLDTTLPPIRELVLPRPEIAALAQPVGFEGGSPDEKLADFYVRVSERLRHKNRAIARWDIEHLVLEHFPFVRETKCVTAMEYPPLPAGTAKVVVIPQAPESELTPMAGFQQLKSIQDFLASKASPFSTIFVINPEYEKIKVTCTIRLKEGLEAEKGLYGQLLHQDLLHFICPWLRGGVVAPGSNLPKNKVLDFIKNLPYVRFVTRFSLVKIFEASEAYFDLTDTARQITEDILKAGTPWSVFVPVAQHLIDFTLDEKNIPSEQAAIESMRLGTDFIVLDTADASKATDTKTTPPDQPATDAEPEWFLVRRD